MKKQRKLQMLVQMQLLSKVEKQEAMLLARYSGDHIHEMRQFLIKIMILVLPKEHFTSNPHLHARADFTFYYIICKITNISPTWLNSFQDGLITLLPRVVDLVCGRDIAVIAAGGIVDERGYVAALALGAHGVSLGTRY